MNDIFYFLLKVLALSTESISSIIQAFCALVGLLIALGVWDITARTFKIAKTIFKTNDGAARMKEKQIEMAQKAIEGRMQRIDLYDSVSKLSNNASISYIINDAPEEFILIYKRVDIREKFEITKTLGSIYLPNQIAEKLEYLFSPGRKIEHKNNKFLWPNSDGLLLPISEEIKFILIGNISPYRLEGEYWGCKMSSIKQNFIEFEVASKRWLENSGIKDYNQFVFK